MKADAPLSRPLISAVICTHNRANYLVRAVDSLVHQSLACNHFEIIVVDNCSTDHTQRAVSARFGHIHNFRLIEEPELGLSRARNTGWKNATGKIVAYLDDDATACRDWLKSLTGAFAHSGVGAAGGPILPNFEIQPPGWFNDSLLPIYSCRVRGQKAFDLPPGHFFYGVNMSIRKNLIEEAGGFRSDLGRRGALLLSDEEFDIFYRIERFGYLKRYVPEAKVRHSIPSERLQIAWLLNRFYWMGRGHVLIGNGRRRSKGNPFAGIVRKARALIRDLRRPRYQAGPYTRLIPAAYFLGYALQASRTAVPQPRENRSNA